jgi:hypothetical protein
MSLRGSLNNPHGKYLYCHNLFLDPWRVPVSRYHFDELCDNKEDAMSARQVFQPTQT